MYSLSIPVNKISPFRQVCISWKPLATRFGGVIMVRHYKLLIFRTVLTNTLGKLTGKSFKALLNTSTWMAVVCEECCPGSGEDFVNSDVTQLFQPALIKASDYISNGTWCSFTAHRHTQYAQHWHSLQEMMLYCSWKYNYSEKSTLQVM